MLNVLLVHAEIIKVTRTGGSVCRE